MDNKGIYVAEMVAHLALSIESQMRLLSKENDELKKLAVSSVNLLSKMLKISGFTKGNEFAQRIKKYKSKLKEL